MLTHKTTYTRQKDGEFSVDINEAHEIKPEDPEYQLAVDMKKMADDNPGKIVVGWKSKSIAIDIEGLDLLDNLSI